MVPIKVKVLTANEREILLAQESIPVALSRTLDRNSWLRVLNQTRTFCGSGTIELLGAQKAQPGHVP